MYAPDSPSFELAMEADYSGLLFVLPSTTRLKTAMISVV
jgi:hypothetical protein